jgi:hypothetical protein
MIAHPLNSKPNKKIRKGNMGEKDKGKKQHPRRQEKVIKSFVTTSTLEKGPVAMVPSAVSFTRIELVEEKEREDSATSNKS